MITRWNPRMFKFYWIAGNQSYEFTEVSVRWFRNLLFDCARGTDYSFPWSSVVLTESAT